jgi:cysteine desulfurase
MNKIYLDYAATAPVDPLVEKAMRPYFSEKFGNPSSLHSFGQEALAAVSESREKIAKSIGAEFREIIFTGSATEANNLALRGVVKKAMRNEYGFALSNEKKTNKNSKLITQNSLLIPRVIISPIEHDSIIKTCEDLEMDGVEVTYLPVSRDGIIDLAKLKKTLNRQTILISVMYANNETGVIQPIAEILKIIKNFRKTNNSLFPLFHTDAVQAFQFLDCDVGELGIDLMTLSAHKIYGPKGVGALFVKKSLLASGHWLKSLITGGDQEFGLRSGTENVAGIVGFSKAVELVVKNREKEIKRIEGLVNCFWKEIKKIYPAARINGPEIGAKNKLPNILNIYFPGHSTEDLLIKLDLAGAAVSSGSACSARALNLSHVLKACGFPDKRIKSSLRFSFGRFTTIVEIKEALKRVKKAVSN